MKQAVAPPCCFHAILGSQLFCQEWDCAAGSSCKNSVIQGVCFEALFDSDGQVVPWVGSRYLQPAKSIRNM